MYTISNKNTLLLLNIPIISMTILKKKKKTGVTKSEENSHVVIHRYDNVLRDTMDVLAPVRSRTIVLRPNAPWYNEDIGNENNEKRKRCRLKGRWRSSRIEQDRSS